VQVCYRFAIADGANTEPGSVVFRFAYVAALQYLLWIWLAERPRMRRSLAFVLIAGLLAACSPNAPERPADEDAAPSAPVGAKLATVPDITAADIAARVKELADDKYEGRGPGSVAGEASAQWIADEMKRAGLEPGNGDSWFQTVGMVAQTTLKETSSLTVTTPAGPMELRIGADAVFNTPRQDAETVSVADTDMVFVGYGVAAPEAGWNDYAGVDVRDKTVVMFVNDPGFITNDASLFNGRAMTYYGRWTYKFEEASRQGAAAVLLIHETEPASYGWEVVQSSWTGEQANLVLKDAGASLVDIQGWISLETATKLFEAAGLDIDAQRAAANKRGFKAVPMSGLKLSGTVNQTAEKRTSRNVIGTRKGATTPEEHVLFVAHWDHLGKDDTAMPGVDNIYNGAVDNATGTAIILEAAEAIGAQPALDRSVTFLAVTLEESGLLGSAYFADNPLIPLNKIVGGLNIDAVLPIGATRDVIVVGAGASQLEDMLKTALDKVGMVARPDPEPQAGYFYRSDHISLAKKGVPMLYLDGGLDAVDGGEARGKAMADAYNKTFYHAPLDEYRDSWDFTGLEAVARIALDVAQQVGKAGAWPEWYEGNEFRAIRENSLKSGG
jgi:Zn-dependent M28 family amino/carboxypeptidase